MRTSDLTKPLPVMRTCHFCDTETDDNCPKCLAAFPHRRSASQMAPDERADELDTWFGIVEIPMSLTHQRIEELVGRPVWTHEFSNPLALIHETRTGQAIGMDEVVANIAGRMQPIVVVVPS